MIRSRPSADKDWKGAIAGNDTDNLVQDCEELRKHLNVDSWHVVSLFAPAPSPGSSCAVGETIASDNL